MRFWLILAAAAGTRFFRTFVVFFAGILALLVLSFD
jgi:hypothetical protein